MILDGLLGWQLVPKLIGALERLALMTPESIAATGQAMEHYGSPIDPKEDVTIFFITVLTLSQKYPNAILSFGEP